MVERIACCHMGITNAQRVPLRAARETPERKPTLRLDLLNCAKDSAPTWRNGHLFLGIRRVSSGGILP
jgi:hypothetical protein